MNRADVAEESFEANSSEKNLSHESKFRSLFTTQRGVDCKAQTIGNALRELSDKLPGRPDLLWLMTALDCYRRDDQPCRDIWDRHVNLRLKLRDGASARESANEYWRRAWNMREKARRIIEGRAPWPAELLAWKLWKELLFSAGTESPAWLDKRNKRTLYHPRARNSKIKDKIAAKRRERRKRIAAR